MNATPLICPTCGELVIVWPETDGRTMMVPAHPDRIAPFQGCPASSCVLTDGNLLLP